MPKLKLLLIAGARPNFMKIAPLIKAIGAHNQAGSEGKSEIQYVLVHTGQHYDEEMSEVFFRELGIPLPDINLHVGSGSHAEQTGRAMMAFEPVCLREKPDWVVVVGDVNSTLACTLVASKVGVRVAHIEAGLRSFDRTMPEEVNRLATDALADLLLTPSADADDNLRREGIPAERIYRVGNIMIDALLANLDVARRSVLPKILGLRRRGFAYVTLHRPGNVDDPGHLQRIMQELSRLAQRMAVVFPVHPRTRKMLKTHGIQAEGDSNLKLIDPIGYHDSLCLCEEARLILTDSGGLQEESTYFRTPCLTLRPNTERPVTISLGSNKLTAIDRLREDLEQTLAKGDRLGEVPPLWDGKTAGRIVEVLLRSTLG